MTIAAADICAALDKRYAAASQGRDNEKWVTIREARAGAGFDGNRGACDYLAINTWQSQGMQLIGHEVKVSYADWQNELVKPEKSELFAQYCRRWWVVVPSDLAARVKAELPPTWGLLSVSDKTVREAVPAPAREPKPVPPWWWIGWLAQLDRRDKRGFTADVNEHISAEVQRRVAVERDRDKYARIDHEASLELNNLREWKQRTDEVLGAAGLTLGVLRISDVNRLKQIAPFLGWNPPSVETLVGQLRKMADALDVTEAS